MEINGKEYTTTKPEEVNLRQSKLLVMTLAAYDAYAEADTADEEPLYAKLKDLWRKVVESLISGDTEQIKDLDKVSLPVFRGVIKSFFPQSSEVKS